MQDALDEAGLAVRHAPDGLDGMRQALRDHPDLVVLDFAAEDATDVMRARRALRDAGIALLVVAAGEVTDDKDLQREGRLDKAKPKVKDKVARAKDKAEGLTDRAADKLR